MGKEIWEKRKREDEAHGRRKGQASACYLCMLPIAQLGEVELK